MQIQNFSIRKLIQNFSIRKLNFELYKLMNLVTSNKHSDGGLAGGNCPTTAHVPFKTRDRQNIHYTITNTAYSPFYYYYNCATIESLTDTNPFVLFF